jgi:hypothetical protein
MNNRSSLTAEEQEILAAYERSNPESVATEQLRTELVCAARQALKEGQACDPAHARKEL